MHHMALRARAIWLMGICCSELPGELWADATTLVVQNLANADLVVALTSVSAMVGIVSNLLDESLVSPLAENCTSVISIIRRLSFTLKGTLTMCPESGNNSSLHSGNLPQASPRL